MKQISLFISYFLWALTTQAQFLPTANLTVFSEDGYKFFLILNGERMNDEAQTNIRIEELPNPYYNCRIIFEDRSQKELVKNNLMLTDGDGIPMDVTYKIKKDKSGKQVLRFFSFIPAEQNMLRPANTMVYRYGAPSAPIWGPGIQANVNIPGGRNGQGGAQINVNVPNVNVNVNTGRNTTTRQYSEEVYYDDSFDGPQTNQRMQRQNVRMNNMPCATPMTARDFEDALKIIRAESFDETRLNIAKQVMANNCLNTSQIVSICNLFSFEKNKLDFAKFAYGYCSEQRNYFRVNQVFNFDASKQELNNYIQSIR